MEKRKIVISLISLMYCFDLFAFCGFFVSKAGTDLFNDASKVVLARHDGKTVLSMANNFKGDMKEFAMVIPVPEVLKKGQINVASNSLIEHLDSYTAPRLVEYRDADPCDDRMYEMVKSGIPVNRGKAPRRKKMVAKDLGVKIEAKYEIGEYDILILSAKESSGLIIWLKQNGYKIPNGAEEIVGSYIKKGMKFFVAKVNLTKQEKLGYQFLRPLQMAYSSEKFMLPIRLGMLNAKGPQDLFVFALTQKGRVESVNYKTKELPSNLEIPTYIKNEFPKFYTDMYSHQVKEDKMKSVWLEYAWDMSWCDPCAADPLSKKQLKSLGVFWQKENAAETSTSKRSFRPRPGNARNVFVTRLHIRYDKNSFPDDLQFQETANKTNFQGRYILRHKWTGKASCEVGKKYLASLKGKLELEAKNLHTLTGRNLTSIREKLNIRVSANNKKPKKNEWWDSLWND